MVAGPLELIDLAFECLDEGDIEGAEAYRSELQLQMDSFGADPQLKNGFNNLCGAIRAKRTGSSADISESARNTPASSPS